MSNENLPIKKVKKSNIFKRGLSAFLAFIGISGVGYQQAKTMDAYNEDYNTNPGYNEKATENIDAKYDEAFRKIGVAIDDISEDKLVDIEDKVVAEDKLVDIEDKVVAEDKLVDIEDKIVAEDKLVDIEDKVVAEDKLVDIEDKIVAEDKLVDIEDKIVAEDKLVDIEDKSSPMSAELRGLVNNDDISQYIEDKLEDKGIEDKNISDKDIEDKEI